MYDVFKVVNWLRVKNHADMRTDPNVEELTQMKVMKLLYYIQAANLTITGHRLFDNDIVAWKYGPVIEEVHERYKGCRGIVDDKNPITDSDIADYQELEANEAVSDILNSIYDVYGYSSAYDLMLQTHKEKPWKVTPQSAVISDDVIKNFYSGVFVTNGEA